ncbi:MAG: hypothetical protein L0Y71_00425 [Gemmataceae bacterium]|nr:hypothetical protein [Gemmataceae bacterium]
MMILANLFLDPAAIAAWIGVGLASGWLTGALMEEPSYGSLGNYILGGMGGLIGGAAFGYFKYDAGLGWSVLVAIGCAWFLILGGRTVVALRSE